MKKSFHIKGSSVVQAGKKEGEPFGGLARSKVTYTDCISSGMYAWMSMALTGA